MVCVSKISNAILWTPFVTPHGNQTQYDQTKRVSYYMKERTEESGKFKHNYSCPDLVGSYKLLFGIEMKYLVSRVCALSLVKGVSLHQ